MIGLREIEITQDAIRELRAAGETDRAEAIAAILAEAVNSLTVSRGQQPRPFLTSGEAARALGVSIQTVKNWAAAGRLRMVQLGGRNVIPRDELLAYLESLRSAPRSAGPFDGAGVEQDRVRAGLPADLVEHIDAQQETIEGGSVPSDEARRLEKRASSAAKRRITEAIERNRRSARLSHVRDWMDGNVSRAPQPRRWSTKPSRAHSTARGWSFPWSVGRNWPR